MLLAILYLPQGLDFIEALTKNIKMLITLKSKDFNIINNFIFQAILSEYAKNIKMLITLKFKFIN